MNLQFGLQYKIFARPDKQDAAAAGTHQVLNSPVCEDLRRWKDDVVLSFSEHGREGWTACVQLEKQGFDAFWDLDNGLPFDKREHNLGKLLEDKATALTQAVDGILRQVYQPAKGHAIEQLRQAKPLEAKRSTQFPKLGSRPEMQSRKPNPTLTLPNGDVLALRVFEPGPADYARSEEDLVRLVQEKGLKLAETRPAQSHSSGRGPNDKLH